MSPVSERLPFVFAWALILLACLSVAVSQADGMRALDPIGDPDSSPDGTVSVPVEAVETFVHRLADAWNTQDLDLVLAEDFPDRSRVVAGFPGRVVPGTRLRILSVGPVQTVEQTRDGNRLISLVIARVHAQLEVPLPDGSFRRDDTLQELVIRVVREVPG